MTAPARGSRPCPIIWVNGAFGSGKTTLVKELRSRRPEALVYDPEMVGFVLRKIVDVPTGDFQDLRLWRRQVAELAVGLVEEYRRPVLVPMTLVDPAYVDEIFGALKASDIEVHHFFLRVPPIELEKRIDGRTFFPADPEREEQVRQWAKARIERCTAAADALPHDTHFLDGKLAPAELADRILASVPLLNAPGGGPQGPAVSGGSHTEQSWAKSTRRGSKSASRSSQGR
ncbi:AAA family ATPase [Streptomyces sp. OF8]|uniref:AAA family ATPase n=1 Tax=Streptomyces alkaliterrae TaxID=2213162 RepID=A0A5P0YZ10_9ACTN|nr:AAA family ATPase [Streptomyces alkaliterrae]MQS03719.1 AAA family ATPase [Streptomyces alkaliterrae]